jgi:GT2 family glycosyltransferase
MSTIWTVRFFKPMAQDIEKELSIIIVSWKVKNLLKNCLDSIFSDTSEKKSEVIVVDNNSQDGSVEMIQSEFPQVSLISNQENVGFGKACNQAIRIAQGNYIFILNPDTIVKPDTLQNIVNFMDCNPKVGIGGCYVYYPNGTPQSSFYRFPTLLSYFSRMFSLFRILSRNRFTQKFFWEYEDNNIAGPIDRVLGGAMVLRKETLRQIGTFDEVYFMYAEELDLCYRAKQMGWKVSTIPNTEIVHYHQQSSLQNIRETTFHGFKSDFLFFKKFYPVYKLIIFRIMQFCGIFFRLLSWLGIYLYGTSKKTLAKEKLAGYLRLLFSNFDYSKSIFR